MGTRAPLAPQQCSLAEHRHTSDPFDYVDGHYVGHDGFVVPKDFAEFNERFPQHIRGWVKRHAGRCSSEDIDEWTQELCVHMSSLPARSEHRNSGKRDVIETFDPVRQYGANFPRFLNYINRCLANRFRTIQSKRTRNPICHASALFLCHVGEVESADEPLQPVLERLKAIDLRSRKQVEDKLLIGQFVDFVRAENPRLVSVLGTMTLTGTQAEAARQLGLTSEEVGRLYRQIREFGRSFLNRKPTTQRNQYSVRWYRTKANASTAESMASPTRPSADPNSTCWNRVDLYHEVWNQPLVKLSRKYGISDVRLGKVCRKLKIPHPGRGYWARRSVGQTIEQAPLPEFKDAPLVKRLNMKSKRKNKSRGNIAPHRIGSD